MEHRKRSNISLHFPQHLTSRQVVSNPPYPVGVKGELETVHTENLVSLYKDAFFFFPEVRKA